MKTILVVDDNPANLTMVRETLKELYRPVLVTSGEQALKFLDKKEADLILLDICMPGMDGIDTLKEINKLPGEPRKVIMLTALSEDDTIEEGRRLGAIDVISKPFHPAEMKEKIRKVLGE